MSTDHAGKKRILLFTGKGGVGKTTCAAATALAAARRGYRTLIMSSDPAHSLSDALDRPLGPEPVPVEENLHAQEVDLYYSMKKYWHNIRELLLTVFKWQGINQIAAEELAAIPGMSEGSALLWLEQFYNSDDYDVIIVDSAPTGETLTFLSLPQVTEWWLTKAFPFQNLIFQTVGFGVRATTGIPLDKGYKELKMLFKKLRVIHDVLSNPAISSVRLVVNPEKMVIEEGRRAFAYLQLYGYGVDAVIVNRIFPESLRKVPGWEKYLDAQTHYLQEIDDSFSAIPRFKVPHLQQEVFGLELLEDIARHLYGDSNPVEVLYAEKAFAIDKDGDRYVLTIHLPFLEEKDIRIHRFGDQLTIQVHNQRRIFSLPHFLQYYYLKEYTYTNDRLEIVFVEK